MFVHTWGCGGTTDDVMLRRAPKQADRRRGDCVRRNVSFSAKLLRLGAPDADMRLRNLSSGGFMAECGVPLSTGDQVLLQLPGVGYMPAQVRWTSASCIGGLFQAELSRDELGHLMAQNVRAVKKLVRSRRSYPKTAE